MKHFFLIFSFCFSLFLSSQNSPQLNSAEIILALKKLNTIGSVLYIAAHPDDENTRLLGYMAKEKNLRTAYLSLTRGDGGQNLIGKEQGELLGLIRTQELLAARRTDGAEQYFTRANDFGYSKTPEETFSFWNKDSVLADVVWAIRKFKPDVIICRFPTTGEGGHGHHTASAILALEAFDAAADPKKYPEQLVFVDTWQVKRLFWNTFNFGDANTTAPDQLKIDAGVYNPLLGKSYGEIAAESRSFHKSQGFGSAKARGQQIEFFKLLKGDSVKKDLFEGMDLSWKRLSNGSKMDKMISVCASKFNPLSPEQIIPDLVAIYKEIQSMHEKDSKMKYWKKIKLKETENLLLTCSGLWMEAYASNYTGIPNEDVKMFVQIVNRNGVEVKLNTISYFNQTDTTIDKLLSRNELYIFRHKEKLNANFVFSNPYWLTEKHPFGRYLVRDQQLVGQPENASTSKVVFDLNLNGLNLKIERGLVNKYTDPVKGEVYRPFEILPPATVNISDQFVVFNSAETKKVLLTLKAQMNNVSGSVLIRVPEGWSASISYPEFKLVNKGDEILMEAMITPSKITGSGKLEISLSINNLIYNKSIKRIEYDHIPYQFILSDAEAGLVSIDLKKAGKLIGYIPGAGDEIPACLKQIGYDVTILTEELLLKEDLSKFQAIVTGVRAHNTNERLLVHYSKLMEYVKNGGNLIVQYNTNNRIGPVVAKIGPFPFTISRERVTNELAEVRFSNPNHSVLNFPNKITSKDFDGWIQERGIYFASELDKNYETILTMNDPDEKENAGSLIVAKYGKGNFVYTGLVFFRELPAGVSGAYRMFVNLLSIPSNK